MMKDTKVTTRNEAEQQSSGRTSLEFRPSCRICLEGEDTNRSLMKVCKCERHFEHVHSKCIENWIELTNNEFCEMCKVKFKFTKRSMGYLDFVHSEYQDNTNFFNFLIITLLVLYVLSIGYALAYICYYYEPRIIGSLLFVTSTFFTGIFLLFILSKSLNELKAFLKWKFNHFNVTIKKYWSNFRSHHLNKKKRMCGDVLHETHANEFCSLFGWVEKYFLHCDI